MKGCLAVVKNDSELENRDSLPCDGVAHQQPDSGGRERFGGSSASVSLRNTLRALFDAAPRFAGLLDVDGTVRYANPFACAFAGCDESTVLGRSVLDTPWWRHSEAERRRLGQAVTAAAQGQSVYLRTTHESQDGTLHAIECELRPLVDEDSRQTSIFMEGWDAGPLVHAQYGMEKVQRLLEAVLEQSPVGMVIASAPDGTLRFVNRAALDLLGTTMGAVIRDRSLAEIGLLRDWQEQYGDGTPIPESDLPLTRAVRGEATPVVACRLRRADGTVRHVLVSATPVYHQDHTLTAGVVSFWDVTELHITAEQLRRLTNEQRTVLDTVRIGICLTKKRLVQWANPEFVRMFGGPGDSLVDAETSRFYADPHDADRVGTEGYAELRLGGFYVTEALMRRADGATFWCRISGQLVHPSDLDAGAIWVLQDISERRRWEDALQRSERLLAAIIGASPEMIVVSRMRDGRIIQVNEAFTRRTGYERESVIGRTALELRLWANEENSASLLQRANTSGEVRNQEAQLRHRSGQLIDALVSGAAFTVDGEQLLVWIAADITDYKRAQQAIRDTEERFARLAEQSGDVIVATDATGKVLSLVGPAEAILGYRIEELDTKAMGACLHPDDLAVATDAYAVVLASSGTAHHVEFRVRRASGDYVAVQAVGRNLLAERSIHAVVWNIREITERKQAEAERARLQEQLQQAMKMEAVGRLAGGVAHDFNNLLTVIAGNIELAKDEVAPGSPLAHTLSEVAKATDSAAALTRQLLAFSRRQIVDPRRVNLSTLVEDLQKMLRRLVGEDIAFVVRLRSDLGTIRVDPAQIEQVIVNLVVNARDAMPTGGRLTIETDNVRLDEAYCQAHVGVEPGAYVMLAVSDNGQGMSAQVRSRIFEPFFTTKERERGTGLGLAMVFGVVAQARGTIEVYSEVGLGAVFKIYLPRVDEPADTLQLRPAMLAVAKGNETVLIVEDDPSVRQVAASMLSRLGYRVLVAVHGDEALRLARENCGRIDVLMTDIVMPGMNGRELAEHVRSLYPRTRVLYTSGYTEDVIIRHGIQQEDVAFVGKPYSMQTLASKLRQVLDTQREN